MKMAKNLREYIALVEEEQDHPNGTYAELVPSSKSLRVIGKIINQLSISNPTPTQELHCTLVYSRKPSPGLVDFQPDFPVKAQIVGFKIFPTQAGTNCLVLELDSAEIQELHKYARSLGCTHDYPEYTPHVTLTYSWPSDQLPSMDLNGTSLIFDHWHVKPLDPTYIPGKDQ